jgi:hypothetical protein
MRVTVSYTIEHNRVLQAEGGKEVTATPPEPA